MSTKILIVVNQEAGQPDLRETLSLEKNFEIAGVVPYKEIAAKPAPWRPQIVVFDNISVSLKKKIELIEKIKLQFPPVHILVLTVDTDHQSFHKMIKAGVLGYIFRDSEPAILMEAVKVVARGEAYIQPCLLSKLLLEFRQLSDEKELTPPEQLSLTARELEVVSQIARGKSNRDIAEQLFISEKTVKNHVSNILRKMSLEDRTQIAVYAYQKRLIT
ncbi:MAG: response regulator transcription factor [Firmicutes bacterium]|nr:response regulator transcription factor [Bacillota bacterium]